MWKRIHILLMARLASGPRGGLLLTNDAQLARKIDSAIFPGMQGSLHPNTIAAKAVCFKEAQGEEFKAYQKQIVKNASTIAKELSSRSYRIV